MSAQQKPARLGTAAETGCDSKAQANSLSAEQADPSGKCEQQNSAPEDRQENMNESVRITPETLSKLQEAVAQAAASRPKRDPEQRAASATEKAAAVHTDDSRGADAKNAAPEGARKAADGLSRERQSSSNTATNSNGNGSGDQQSKQQSPTKSVQKPSSGQRSPHSPAAVAVRPASKEPAVQKQSSPTRSQPRAAASQQVAAPTQEAARNLLNAVVSSVPPAQANEAVSSLLSLIQTDPSQGQAALSSLVAALGGSQAGPALAAALNAAKKAPASSAPSSSSHQGANANALALQSLQRMANERLQSQQQHHNQPHSTSQPATSPSHNRSTPQDSLMYHASPTSNPTHPSSNPRSSRPGGASPPDGQRSHGPSSSAQATPSASAVASAAAAAQNSSRRGGNLQSTVNNGRSGAAAGPPATGSEVLKRTLANPATSTAQESPAHKKGRFSGSTMLRDTLSRRSGAPGRTPTPPNGGPAGKPQLSSAPGAVSHGSMHAPNAQSQPRRSRRMSEGGIAAMPESRAPDVSTGDALTHASLAKLRVPRQSEDADMEGPPGSAGRDPSSAGGARRPGSNRAANTYPGQAFMNPPSAPGAGGNPAASATLNALLAAVAGGQGAQALGNLSGGDAHAALNALVQMSGRGGGMMGHGGKAPQGSAAQMHGQMRDMQVRSSDGGRGITRMASLPGTSPAGSGMQPTLQQQQYAHAVAAAAAAAGGLGSAQAQRLLAAAAATQQQQQQQQRPSQQQQQAAAAAQHAAAQAAAAQRSRGPDAVDTKHLLAQLDPAALNLLLNSGNLPAHLIPSGSAPQSRSSQPVTAADVPLSAALETQAVLRRLSTDGSMRSTPPSSMSGQAPPGAHNPEANAAFAQLEKLFGPKVAASIMAVHAPSLITKSAPQPPPQPPQSVPQNSDSQFSDLLRTLMGPNAPIQNLQNLPQNLQSLQNLPQLAGLADYANALQGGDGGGSNNGGQGSPRVHAVRADLQAALLAGVSSGRLPASAVQYSAGLPQSMGGPGGLAPSRRKQSPMLSLSSFDRGAWGNTKRQSDAAGNTSIARNPRSSAEDPPMLLTTNDLTQPGSTHATHSRGDRRASNDTSTPTASGAVQSGAAATAAAALGRGGSSAALAALAAATQQPSSGTSGDALQVLMSALSNDATAAEREHATAALARVLEGQGMSARRQPSAIPAAASAPPSASQPPAATDLTANGVRVKQEEGGDGETMKADARKKSLGSTEDELQAAALLISLKDSSSPGAAAPSTQKTEHDAPQVSWAAFSGGTATNGAPQPSGSMQQDSKHTALHRVSTAGSPACTDAAAAAAAAAAQAPPAAAMPQLKAAVNALTGTGPSTLGAIDCATRANGAPNGDLGSPIAKALLQQLLGGWKSGTGNGSTAPTNGAGAASGAGGAAATVPGLPPGVSVMCKESEEAGRPALGDLGKGGIAGGSFPAGIALPGGVVPASLPLILQAPQGLTNNAGAVNAAHAVSLLRSLVAGGGLGAGAAGLPALSQQPAAPTHSRAVPLAGLGGEYWKVDQSQLETRGSEGR